MKRGPAGCAHEMVRTRAWMFITGVYSVPAGTYKGQQIRALGMDHERGRIPVDEYRAYAKEFNPVKYKPTSGCAWQRKRG